MTNDTRDVWDALTGDSDIPAWDALSEVQREALEALGYGPLSYPYYVERYKKWYSQPTADYNLYRYLEKQQDTHWGGHGSDYIEGEFERHHELTTLRADLNAAHMMLAEAREKLAEIAARAANTRRDYPDKSFGAGALATLEQIEAIARGAKGEPK